MKTRQQVGMSLLATLLAVFAVVSSAGAGITSTWTGNGNPDNDGNWFDTNNWDNGVPNAADDIAILPAPTTRARTVTVNGNVAVERITIGYSGSSYNNILSLGGNLDVGQFTYSPAGAYNNYQVAMNGHTLTLGIGNLTSVQVPALSGTGLFVKTGTGEATLIYNPGTGFTGTYRVDDGVLKGTYARISSSSTIQVPSGATYYMTVSAGESPSLIFTGTGYDNQGAFRTVNYTYGKTITLDGDTSIAVNSGHTLNLTGTFSGTGKLTKIGEGKLLIAGSSDAYTADTTIQTGTIEVTGLFRGSAITVKDGATLIAPPYRVGVGKVTVESGGTWDTSAQPEWIKGTNVDGNDDGNWGDGVNWGTGEVPTTLAILPSVAGNGSSGNNIRTVTIGSPGNVGTLNMLQSSGSFANRLLVDADFAIGTLTLNPEAWGSYRIEVPDGRTLEVGAAAGGFPNLYGAGTIRKTGAGNASLIYSSGITWNGTYRAEGGITHLNYNRIAGVQYVVEDGGTLRVDNTTESGHTTSTITIAGQGHIAGTVTNGAIWCSNTVGGNGLAQAVTVTADAMVKVDATRTLGLKGTLSGSGKLTLTGGGTLDLYNNTWNVTPNGTALNGIVVENGTLDISKCHLALTVLNDPPSGRYILVDHSAASGARVGETFASETGLPEKWFIEYTADSVVLVNPPPAGTLISIR